MQKSGGGQSLTPDSQSKYKLGSKDNNFIHNVTVYKPVTQWIHGQDNEIKYL